MNVMPKWADKLISAYGNGLKNYKPCFEELKDMYVFLRSTRNLFIRSEIMFKEGRTWIELGDKLDYLFTKEGFASIVHIKVVIDKLIQKRVGPDIGYKERLTEFELGRKKKSTRDEKRGKGYLKEGSRLNRAANWQWRLEAAIRETVKDGWYPMFGTYTVDPKGLPKGCLTRDDLWTKTPAWDRFIKKIKTAVAEASGYGRRPAAWPKGNTFFKYYALLEHGASGEHPHVHVIWLCKAIPNSWKVDPNRNCSTNTNTDIVAASALWSHGIQRKTMGLFIVGSWFTKNWNIPVKVESGKPIQVGDAGAVAGYVGKYMRKGVTKKWNHRTKATHGLGMESLQEKLKKCKTSLLVPLAYRPTDYRNVHKMQSMSGTPLNLIRIWSTKELLKRLHSCQSLRAKTFLWKIWTQKQNSFYMKYISNVRDGVKPWKMMQQQLYNYYTQILEAQPPETAHSKTRMLEVCNWLKQNAGIEENCKCFTLLKGADSYG